MDKRSQQLYNSFQWLIHMSNVLLFSNVYSAFKWLPISNDLLLVLELKGKYRKKKISPLTLQGEAR